MKLQHKSDYAARRVEEYPPLADQLDMLWHAMNTGGMDKVEPFYSTIKSIKQRYPVSSV